jgi:electron transfer flavoprotein alpha subunit
MDCVGLALEAGSQRLLMTKPVYGGNALAMQVCESDPQIATVRAKVMVPLERNPQKQGEVIKIEAGLEASSLRSRLVERKIEASGVKLEEAKVIVTGGRGLGGPEGFRQLEELAKLLKGAIGASRPACDNKWVSDNLQIGLTGKIVSPDLYITVGVSGSSQHLSGCSGARVMVAINKDAEANIFKVAHFGIVADWKKALPAFTAKVKELQS